MLSNQTIQASIDELRSITRIDLCVMDQQGTVAASTMEAMDTGGTGSGICGISRRQPGCERILSV